MVGGRFGDLPCPPAGEGLIGVEVGRDGERSLERDRRGLGFGRESKGHAGKGNRFGVNLPECRGKVTFGKLTPGKQVL